MKYLTPYSLISLSSAISGSGSASIDPLCGEQIYFTFAFDKYYGCHCRKFESKGRDLTQADGVGLNEVKNDESLAQNDEYMFKFSTLNVSPVTRSEAQKNFRKRSTKHLCKEKLLN
jgi:hypothetical protein